MPKSNAQTGQTVNANYGGYVTAKRTKTVPTGHGIPVPDRSAAFKAAINPHAGSHSAADAKMKTQPRSYPPMGVVDNKRGTGRA